MLDLELSKYNLFNNFRMWIYLYSLNCMSLFEISSFNLANFTLLIVMIERTVKFARLISVIFC